VGVRARPESDIVFPEESLSRIRPEMRVIIARLCDRNPDTRYASLTEAIEDLKRFQHDFPAPEGFAKSLCKIVEGIEVVKAGFDPKQIVESGDKRAFTLALLKEVSANFESARLAQMDSGYVTDSSELVRTTSDSVASRQKARRKSRKRNRSRLWPAVALVNASLLVLVVFWFGLRTPTHPEPAVVYKETAPLLVPINLVAPMNAQALWLQPNEPPTFTWSRGAAAGEFSLEVATDAEFKKVVLAANVEGTSYRSGQPFPEGAYYWRLSRSNGPTFEGPLKFSVNTVAPLDLIHPHSNSPLTVAPAEKQLAVEFSWVCKPGASSYIVQISHSPRFERIVKEGVLAMCSENWINLPAGQYYWRARMESPSIERYPWSAVAGFTIQRKTKTVPPSPAPAHAVAANPKPVLKKRSVEKPVIAEPVAVAAPKPVVLPAPRPLEIKQVFTLKFNESGMARDIASVRAQMTAPQLAWAPVEGASSYKVEISRTPDFTQKIFKGITKTSHLDWTAATPGRVFWRVTAVGATESASSYGCQLDVRLPAPALMSTYSDSPRGFEWETIPLAERYIVEWDHSRTMANKSQKLTKRAQTQFDMSQGSVFVRVATANRKGERTSEFSRIARIVTLP
ncbi:MAG: hypothetical protein ACXVA9_12960, partial [Bdellovibrionales bacterium]